MIPHLPQFIFRNLYEGCYKFVQWGDPGAESHSGSVWGTSDESGHMMEHKPNEYVGKVPCKFRGNIFLWRWFLGQHQTLNFFDEDLVNINFFIIKHPAHEDLERSRLSTKMVNHKEQNIVFWFQPAQLG